MALRRRERLLPEKHVSTAATLGFLGEAHLLLHEHDLAWQYAQRTHAMRLALFGEAHRMSAESYYLLGRVLHARGELDRARMELERALQINKALPDGENYVVLLTFAALGDVLADQQRHNDAQTYQERAIAGWGHAHAHDYSELVRPLTSLGRLLWRQGDTDGTQTHLQRAQRIGETKLGNAHPWTANVRAQLAALER